MAYKAEFIITSGLMDTYVTECFNLLNIFKLTIW